MYDCICLDICMHLWLCMVYMRTSKKRWLQYFRDILIIVYICMKHCSYFLRCGYFLPVLLYVCLNVCMYMFLYVCIFEYVYVYKYSYYVSMFVNLQTSQNWYHQDSTLWHSFLQFYPQSSTALLHHHSHRSILQSWCCGQTCSYCHLLAHHICGWVHTSLVFLWRMKILSSVTPKKRTIPDSLKKNFKFMVHFLIG